MKDLHILPDDDSPKSLRNWRIRVVIVSCSSLLIIWFLIIPAMFTGLPKLGSLAWSNEVDARVAEEQRKVDYLLELTLEKSILDAHKNWCESGDDESRATAWAERVRDKSREYLKFMKREFSLPTCDRV